MPLRRHLVLVASMVATSAGWSITPSAVAQTEQQGSESPAESGQAADGGWAASLKTGGIPLCYSYHQPQSPVFIDGTTATEDHLFERVRVRNISPTPLTSVTFVAIVEKTGFPTTSARIVRSSPISTTVPPGASRDLVTNVLPVHQALDVKMQLGGRAQACLGLVAAELADGTRWTAELRQGAHTYLEALRTTEPASSPRPRVSRSRVSAQGRSGEKSLLCRDDDGLEYSQGAVVPVLGEADRFAQCDKGMWVDYDRSGPR